MSNQVLDKVVQRIAQAPQSAASLTLYALVSTLEYESAGYLFKLDKLRGLDEKDRQLAYGLMELMAAGENQGKIWQQAKNRMDELVRSG